MGLPISTILFLLKSVRPFVIKGDVDSIRFSTRPDTIDHQKLDLLSAYPVSTVELGVQSMNDGVLKAARRGHLAKDTIRATKLLKSRGYEVGLQMMVGLPSDDDEGAMETASRIELLKPDFVRIYPTVVLKGSKLADQFNAGRYNPMPMATCITLVKRLFLYFKTHHIPVIRMGLQVSEELIPSGELIAGPYHPAFGHLVHSEIVFDAMKTVFKKMDHQPRLLTITSHPNLVSRVQGQKKQNIDKLKRTFGLHTVNLVQDADLPIFGLKVNDRWVILP